MYVARIGLESFRNYERAEVEFAPGLNLVAGRNAQGKTNLLEAVHCLSGLGSPRSPDAQMIQDGAERAVLHGSVVRGERTLGIDLEFRPGRSPRALINRAPAPSVRALTEVVVAVYFGPDDLALVKGSPDTRRRFLDDLVVKLRPTRFELRREWERVLKQRNALLRTAPRGSGRLETLEVWDESFVRIGSALAAARLEALTVLAPFVAKRYEAIAGGGSLDIGYESSWIGDEAADWAGASPPNEVELRALLAAALAEVKPKELERKVSLIGPHRDDLGTWLVSAGTPGAARLHARRYASQGDQRTCALALRLAEHDLLARSLREDPILLLDDVFSELDPSRREWLADSVARQGQTILTSAEAGAAEAATAERVIEVADGRIIDG